MELENAEDVQNPDSLVSEEGNDPSAYGASTSRKIEVPSNKVLSMCSFDALFVTSCSDNF